MPVSILLQTCWHNLLTDIEFDMGILKVNTWKELKDQIKIIENSLCAKSANDNGKQPY